MRLFLAAIAAITLLPSPLLAQDDGAAKPDDTNKKICKNVVATGSIMPTRVCHTKAQWDAITGKSSSDLDRTRDMERSRSMVGLTRGTDRSN